MLWMCQRQVVQRFTGVKMLPRFHAQGVPAKSRNVSVIEDHGVERLVEDLVDNGLLQVARVRMSCLNVCVDQQVAASVVELCVGQIIVALSL